MGVFSSKHMLATFLLNPKGRRTFKNLLTILSVNWAAFARHCFHTKAAPHSDWSITAVLGVRVLKWPTFVLSPPAAAIGRTLIPRYFSTVFEGGVTELHYILKHSKESFHNSCITLDCDQCTMVTQHGKPMFTKVMFDPPFSPSRALQAPPSAHE